MTEIEHLAEQLHQVFLTLDKRWEGYDEELKPEDFAVAVAAMIDHLDASEGALAIDLPNVGLMVDRNEHGEYNVWIHAGAVNPEVEHDE